MSEVKAPKADTLYGQSMWTRQAAMRKAKYIYICYVIFRFGMEEHDIALTITPSFVMNRNADCEPDLKDRFMLNQN